jgi:hypothetical protein
VQKNSTPVLLDSENVASLGKLPSFEYMLVDFRVRVADDSLEGTSQLEVWHQSDVSQTWNIDDFDVQVQGKDVLEISVSPSSIKPGKPTDIVFSLKNSGTASIHDATLAWSEKNNLVLPLGSGNSKYVASISPGETASAPFTVTVDSSAPPGNYLLSTNVSYTIGSDISKSALSSVGIFIGDSSDFDVASQGYQPGSGTLSLSISNVGANPTSSVLVGIPAQSGFTVSGPSSSFLGDLSPGDFAMASFKLAPSSNSSQSQSLTVRVSYTDSSGNRQSLDKQVILAYQQAQHPAGQETPMPGLLIYVSAAGLVIAIVLLVLLTKRRK